jgi:hypothetical protein
VLVHFLNAAEEFAVSLAAFAVWTHFDLDGWFRQRHIERGRKLEEKRNREGANR